MGTTKEEYNSGLKKYALIISFLGIIAILFQLSVVYNLFYYFIILLFAGTILYWYRSKKISEREYAKEYPHLNAVIKDKEFQKEFKKSKMYKKHLEIIDKTRKEEIKWK
jgi:hypothetical protein